MTVREAFNTLDEPYRSQAIKNTQLWQLDHPVVRKQHQISGAIAEAFIWDETEEGDMYWRKLSFDLLKQNL
jgi:uncharacterized protein (DUF2249 family)